VPEVVDDGITGRIVDSIDEAVAAVDEVAAFDRCAVRRRFEERFSAERMVNDYLTIYESAVSDAVTAMSTAA
jgi:glycosyltransferase involved in cell wall biosynthesis